MILVENEMKQLNFEKEQNELNTQVHWKDFVDKKYLRRPLIMTILIQCGQNLTGIDAVNYFEY